MITYYLVCPQSNERYENKKVNIWLIIIGDLLGKSHSMGSFDKSKLKSASFINRSSGRRKEITESKKSAKAIFESPPEKEKEKEKGGSDNLSDTYSMSSYH